MITHYLQTDFNKQRATAYFFALKVRVKNGKTRGKWTRKQTSCDTCDSKKHKLLLDARLRVRARESCEKGTDDEQWEKKKIKVPQKRGEKIAREMKQKGNQRKKERKKDEVRSKQKMDNKC